MSAKLINCALNNFVLTYPVTEQKKAEISVPKLKGLGASMVGDAYTVV